MSGPTGAPALPAGSTAVAPCAWRVAASAPPLSPAQPSRPSRARTDVDAGPRSEQDLPMEDGEECSLPLPLPATRRPLPTVLWLDPRDQALAEDASESEVNADDNDNVSDSSSLAGGGGAGARGAGGYRVAHSARGGLDSRCGGGGGGAASDLQLDTCCGSLPEAPPSAGPEAAQPVPSESPEAAQQQQQQQRPPPPQQQPSDAPAGPTPAAAVVSSAVSTCPDMDCRPEPTAGGGGCPAAAAQASEDAGLGSSTAAGCGGGSSSTAAGCGGGSSSCVGGGGGPAAGSSSGVEAGAGPGARARYRAQGRPHARRRGGGDAAVRRVGEGGGGAAQQQQQQYCDREDDDDADELPIKRSRLSAAGASATPRGAGGAGSCPARRGSGGDGEGCRCARCKAPPGLLSTAPAWVCGHSAQPPRPLLSQLSALPGADAQAADRPSASWKQAAAVGGPQEGGRAGREERGVRGAPTDLTTAHAARLGSQLRSGEGLGPWPGPSAQPPGASGPTDMAAAAAAAAPSSPEAPPTPSESASQHPRQLPQRDSSGVGSGGDTCAMRHRSAGPSFEGSCRTVAAPPGWAPHHCSPAAVTHRRHPYPHPAGYHAIYLRHELSGGAGGGGSGSATHPVPGPGPAQYRSQAPPPPPCYCPLCSPHDMDASRGGAYGGYARGERRSGGGGGSSGGSGDSSLSAAATRGDASAALHGIPPWALLPRRPASMSPAATAALAPAKGSPGSAPPSTPTALATACWTADMGPVTPKAQHCQCPLCATAAEAAAAAAEPRAQPSPPMPCLPYMMHGSTQLNVAHGDGRDSAKGAELAGGAAVSATPAAAAAVAAADTPPLRPPQPALSRGYAEKQQQQQQSAAGMGQMPPHFRTMTIALHNRYHHGAASQQPQFRPPASLAGAPPRACQPSHLSHAPDASRRQQGKRLCVAAPQAASYPAQQQKLPSRQQQQQPVQTETQVLRVCSQGSSSNPAPVPALASGPAPAPAPAAATTTDADAAPLHQSPSVTSQAAEPGAQAPVTAAAAAEPVACIASAAAAAEAAAVARARVSCCTLPESEQPSQSQRKGLAQHRVDTRPPPPPPGSPPPQSDGSEQAQTTRADKPPRQWPPAVQQQGLHGDSPAVSPPKRGGDGAAPGARQVSAPPAPVALQAPSSRARSLGPSAPGLPQPQHKPGSSDAALDPSCGGPPCTILQRSATSAVAPAAAGAASPTYVAYAAASASGGFDGSARTPPLQWRPDLGQPPRLLPPPSQQQQQQPQPRGSCDPAPRPHVQPAPTPGPRSTLGPPPSAGGSGPGGQGGERAAAGAAMAMTATGPESERGRSARPGPAVGFRATAPGAAVPSPFQLQSSLRRAPTSPPQAGAPPLSLSLSRPCECPHCRAAAGTAVAMSPPTGGWPAAPRYTGGAATPAAAGAARLGPGGLSAARLDAP